MTFRVEMLKGSPQYTVTDASGNVFAESWCVSVPAKLWNLKVDGKLVSFGAPEANVVAAMKRLCIA